MNALIDSAIVVENRSLHVYLKQPHKNVPRELSTPALAIAKPSANWPLGSGPYRVEASGRVTGRVSKRIITVSPSSGAPGPVIQFVETSAYDARDLLEGVIDVMITADPSVVEYASSRSRLTTFALAWDHTYVLLSTSRVQELRRGSSLGSVSSDFLDALARDAVRGDARGYRSPSWWEDVDDCGELSETIDGLPPVPKGAYASSGVRRILYDSDDPIARDVAERLVALAASDPSVSHEAAVIASAVPGLTSGAPRLTAEGLTSGELGRSLFAGDDFAYVIAIPRRPPDACYEVRKLLNRAPWLANLEVDFDDALIPLVDTRLHVIANRDRVGLVIDGYGNLLISNADLQEARSQ
jgi:hypothetical protein